ncbi:shock factor protein HSF8 (Partial), partial [Seminavis robusta]
SNPLFDSPLQASSSSSHQHPSSMQAQLEQHSLQLQLQLQEQQRRQLELDQQSLQNELQQRLQLQEMAPAGQPYPEPGQLPSFMATNTAPIDTTIQGATPQVLPPETAWKGRGRSSTFPLKLHQMLLDLEKKQGGTEIAAFLPHGRSFQIFKPKEFSREVLPHYFRMSTFSSFQRQLNLYDFQRISEGPEKGAYWHELFLKDQPMLSTGMKRNKVKGSTRARQEERFKHYSHQQQGQQQHPKAPPRSS